MDINWGKMINNLIYTFYLVSRKRSLVQHFLMAGGTVFFLLFINILTIWAFYSLVIKADFISSFINNEIVVLIGIFIGFFGIQLYTYLILAKLKRGKIQLKRLRSATILIYIIISLLLFFFIIISASIIR